jgi:hypothetical protein
MREERERERKRFVPGGSAAHERFNGSIARNTCRRRKSTIVEQMNNEKLTDAFHISQFNSIFDGTFEVIQLRAQNNLFLVTNLNLSLQE